MQCSLEECKEDAARRGLCHRHYAQRRRAGLLPKSKPCKVEGCERAAVSQGWCPNHYEKIRRGYGPEGKRGFGRITKHSLYPTWQGMIGRCHHPNHDSYERYGGRGVKVCERWRADFWTFVEDVGPKPSKTHTIDRIDNEKGYEPGNCRWATKTEQLANRRITQLTHSLIRELRRRFDAGESARSLSRAYEINYDMVRLCVTRRTWSNVE